MNFHPLIQHNVFLLDINDVTEHYFFIEIFEIWTHLQEYKIF